jgi:hypothetical protein
MLANSGAKTTHFEPKSAENWPNPVLIKTDFRACESGKLSRTSSDKKYILMIPVSRAMRRVVTTITIG